MIYHIYKLINKTQTNMKTKKISKVLIALDYDPTAQKVAEIGYSYAKSMEAEVILLHIIADPVYYSSTEYSPIIGFNGFMATVPFQYNNVEALKEASLSFLNKSRHHLGDATIKTVVETGDPSEAILKVAKEMHVDIIVMGSHSRKWLENIIMGSVTEAVLRHTSIPLFIIPTKKKA